MTIFQCNEVFRIKQSLNGSQSRETVSSLSARASNGVIGFFKTTRNFEKMVQNAVTKDSTSRSSNLVPLIPRKFRKTKPKVSFFFRQGTYGLLQSLKMQSVG